MDQRIEAIYENGVLKPVAPLALPEHQRVSVTISMPLLDDEAWVDRAFEAEVRALPSAAVTLDEVRQLLAHLPDGLSRSIQEERNER